MKDETLEILSNILEYLKTDDYDEMCTYHIKMINDLETLIQKIEEV